jgi:nifR3 family TIM-barrel protein
MNYRQMLQRQPVLPAPMCGISDYAFRSMCRLMGAEITYTQMVSAEALWRGDRKTLDILDLDPAESNVGIQLFGGDAEPLAFAARLVQDLGAIQIDLNMGCPARKITCAHSGSALLRDVPRVGRIFGAMRGAVAGVPLTAKLRWDWDDGEGAALAVARLAESEGLDGLCLHARTREQGYSGVAKWELIAQLKACVSIPVVGNGDVRQPADALDLLRQSGCDAVMIGRALIGDPWLLRETLAAVRKTGTGSAGPLSDTDSHGGFGPAVPVPVLRQAPDWPTRRALMLEHATLMFERRGARGLLQFRKHAVAYLRGLPGAKRLREQLMKISTLEQLDRALAEEALAS